jgi:hypothetical protein
VGRRVAPYPGPMDVAAAHVSEVVAGYTRALRQLADRLETQMAWNLTLIEAMDRDEALHPALSRLRSAESSLEMTRQLAAFDKARFDMRAGLARTLRSQGFSNPEIADAFGVSRQLVHRILADHSGVAWEVDRS